MGVLQLFIILLYAHPISSLTVLLPPSVSVHELDRVNITCSVERDGISSTTAVDVRWSRLGDDQFHQQGEELLIQSASTDDAGTYVCTATASGNVTTATANTLLIVTYSPRWNFDYLSKFGAKIDQNIDLICVVKASPRPEFYWINPRGQNVTTSARYTMTSKADRAILFIRDVIQSDYGLYQCVTNNQAGEAIFNISLLSPGPPDSPKLCSIVSYDAGSVSITCIPGYTGGVEAYYRVYKSTWRTEKQETKSELIKGQEGLVDIKVTGLDPGINYTLQVYAENAFGMSNDSMLLYIKTDGTASPPGSSTNGNLPAILGGSIGGGVFVIICIILLIICCRRCRRSKKSSIPNHSALMGRTRRKEEKDRAAEHVVRGTVI